MKKRLFGTAALFLLLILTVLAPSIVQANPGATCTPPPERREVASSSNPTPPPKSTPAPTPAPSSSSSSSSGGVIELLASLPSSGRVRLHDVSTVVQWQDGLDNWHDVEGWRGRPDTVVNRTAIIGWWVAEKDLGTGPFRWRVYWDVYVDVSGATARVVNSRPFYLPEEGQTVTVDISTPE